MSKPDGDRLYNSKAMADVFCERCRQIDGEGFDAARDDGYINRELGFAAMTYLGTAIATPETREHWTRETVHDHPWWPWDPSWFKPKDRRADLVKAAALIIAEIERLDRKVDGAA